MIRSVTDRRGSRKVATFAICWLLVWLCMNLLLKGCKTIILVSCYCLACMVPILCVTDVHCLLNGYMIWILLRPIVYMRADINAVRGICINYWRNGYMIWILLKHTVICEGRYKGFEGHLHYTHVSYLKGWTLRTAHRTLSLINE